MRPALADVVAVLTGDRALTEFWRVALRPYDPPARIFNRVEVSDRGVATFDVIEGLDPLRRVSLQRWSHATPADALAALVEVELLPEAWLDPERGPRWWCEACEGRGHTCCPCATHCGPSPFDFVSDGATASPPSHPALVAVASLSADALVRAEAIVAETWRARIVWRVESAARIREELDGAVDTGGFGVERAVHVAVVAWFYPNDVADAVRWHDDHPRGARRRRPRGAGRVGACGRRRARGARGGGAVTTMRREGAGERRG